MRSRVPSAIGALFALAVAASPLAAAGCAENETPPPTRAAYEPATPTALPCVPNLDGKIEATEMTPALGIPATFLVSPAGKERTVDLAGATNAEGKLEWRLGADFADDQVARIEGGKLEGRWYASRFASVANAFVAPLDAAGRTEGVYTFGENELRMHGLASAVESPPEGKTLYAYDKPIALYRFPLVPGATWTSTSTVSNGTLRGLPYAGKDTYEVKVDGAGTLTLPDFVLTQALRVRTLVTIIPSAGQTTTQRQTSFVFECLGEVARATSRLNEADENFAVASELRRLGIAP